MTKDLLVTLADENFIDQAKQVFSGVYHNAGWRGDYMLLSINIPEEKLKWFEDRGILVYRCDPVSRELIGPTRASPQMLSKFYLFKPEFKKWEHIIYLDGDIIVRAPIDELAKVEGFSATYDDHKLDNDFTKRMNLKTERQMDLYRKLCDSFNLKEKTFNAGVFSFNTKIIKDDTFSKLNSLFLLYEPINTNGDQSSFNLFFYKNWKKFPRVYNIYIREKMHVIKLTQEIVLHMKGRSGDKPWLRTGFYYQEWHKNLEMADEINLSKRAGGVNPWPRMKVRIYDFLISTDNFLFNTYRMTDRLVGKLGIFIKKIHPGFYGNLKKVKNRSNRG